MQLLIKNVRIVDWSQDLTGDVYVCDGKITEIGRELKKSCYTIEGNGLVLMPSFIDLHVHFREPGYTYKEDIASGSKAAVRGGYTMVNLMANTNPVCSDINIVKLVSNKAKAIGLVDVHQVVSITKNFDGKTLDHLDNLDDSVKIISEDGNDVMDSKVMMEAMIKAKQKGFIVMCHCENKELSGIDTRLAENTMTWRNITLAQYTGCKTHIAHVSTKEALKYVIDAKLNGTNVTCEVTPHHLALSEENCYTVNPPIRAKEDVDYLIEGIKNGYVDVISTDHAPHSSSDKEKGAPGISGIETAFPICYTKLVKEGHINLRKLSEIMSKTPGEIIGCNKGQIKIGYDGDLVLINLEKKYEINNEELCSKGKNTPFNGTTVWGKIIKTIKSGEIVYSEN
ncbi:MAG: dihydroorotase [Clostridiaceae bacterium]|jgi:dihydroorotase|nr:dihydroorotase [Clostridiaceae bacterium]